MTEPQPLQERVNVPPDLANAVDLLVEAHGVTDAENKLQRRFRHREEQKRATAALAYLRRKYDSGGR